MATHHLFKKPLPSHQNTFIRDVTVYQVESSAGEKEIEGYVLTMVTGSETWEAFVKRCDESREGDKDEMEVEIKTGTNWDVKELVFRDPGTMIMICICYMYYFKVVFLDHFQKSTFHCDSSTLASSSKQSH